MRMLLSLGLSLCLAGCALPNRTAALQPEGTVRNGLPPNVLKPGAGVIAAGGGNVIAAGGGNVIAAGGGNVRTDDGLSASASAPRTSPAASVIAAGGANLAVGPDMVLGQTSDSPSPLLPGAVGGTACETPAAATGTVSVRVSAPGELAGEPSALPVKGATVRLYALDGAAVGEARTSDAEGGCTFQQVPQHRILVARAAFEVAGETYYLSSLFVLEQAQRQLMLEGATTLLEAKFFVEAAGALPDVSVLDPEALDALADALAASKLDTALFEAGTTFARRAAAYDARAATAPAAFAGGIDGWAFTPALAPCAADATL